MTRRAGWAIAALIAAAGVARLWSFAHTSTRWFVDSYDYAAQSRQPLFSNATWGAYKPPLTPLLLHFLGSGWHYAIFQVSLAIASWGFLAAVVAFSLQARLWIRVAAAACILGLSLTQAIAQWDRAILTESLAFSLLALTLAIGILLAARFTLLRASAFLLALSAWVAVRDSDAIVVAILALAFLLGVLLRRLDRRMLPIAFGCLLIFALSTVSSNLGRRWYYPTAQIIRVRIMATSEGVRWLAARHPPQLDLAVAAQRKGIVPETAPGFEAWDHWIQSAGRKTMVTWLVEHPSQILVAPISRRDLAAADVATPGYAPSGYHPLLGPLDTLFWMPGATSLVLVIAALLGLFYGRPRQRSLLWVGALCATLALPHAWIAWLLEPFETSRHALVAEVQYRLGLLLLASATAASARAWKTGGWGSAPADADPAQSQDPPRRVPSAPASDAVPQ